MAAIMVVEDNESHRELLELELSMAGHKVAAMSNATDALSHVRRHRPDLVVTDIAMPLYNGVELIQDILRIDKSIPIIIYSAYAAYATTYMAYAADAYVMKSGEYGKLKETIGRLLAARPNTVLCA